MHGKYSKPEWTFDGGRKPKKKTKAFTILDAMFVVALIAAAAAFIRFFH